MAVVVGVIAFCAATSPSRAQERAFCADRPGLGTPACTLDQGKVLLETGVGDWSVAREGEARTETLIAGDLLMRAGLSPSLEAQIGWTAFGRTRIRDSQGHVETTQGAGDISLAMRKNLMNPDGAGVSFALMAQARLPVGNKAIGSDGVEVLLLAPASFELSNGLSLALTPQLQIARSDDDEDADVAFGSVFGLSGAPADKVSIGAEVSFMNNAHGETEWLGGLSAAWMLNQTLQMDAGVEIDLENAGQGRRIYVGLARRF